MGVGEAIYPSREEISQPSLPEEDVDSDGFRMARDAPHRDGATPGDAVAWQDRQNLSDRMDEKMRKGDRRWTGFSGVVLTTNRKIRNPAYRLVVQSGKRQDRV